MKAQFLREALKELEWRETGEIRNSFWRLTAFAKHGQDAVIVSEKIGSGEGEVFQSLYTLGFGELLNR